MSTYDPDNQVVLLNQAEDAAYNKTGAAKNTPHMVSWDQQTNSLLYINTTTGDVEKILFGDAITYTSEDDTGNAVPTSALAAVSNKCNVIVPAGTYTIDFNCQLSATGAANLANIGIYYNTDTTITAADPSDVAIVDNANFQATKWPNGSKWPISIMSGRITFGVPVIIKIEWIDASDQRLFTMSYKRVRAIKTSSNQ